MRIIPFILILFLSIGCAAKKLAVDNADTLINHQITKRLPLYSTQKDELSKDVDRFLAAKKPMAEEIIPVIETIELDSTQNVESQYEKLERFYRNISRDFSQLMSKHMAKLDYKQQKEFFETLDDENRDILKKEKEDRVDQVEERFEQFLGSINSKQKQLVREYADYFQERAKHRLDYRVKLHQNFKAIYNQDASELSRASSFQEKFIEYQEASLKGNKNVEFLKKVVPTLSDSQKEYLRKQLQEVKSLLKYFVTVDY